MSSRQNSRFDGGSDESKYYRRNSSQHHSSSESQYQQHRDRNQANYYDDSSTSRQQQASYQMPSYPAPNPDSSTSRQQQASYQMPSYPAPNPNYQNQMNYPRPSYQAPYGSYQQIPQQHPQQYPPTQMPYDPRVAYGGMVQNQGYHHGYNNLQQQYWTPNQSAVPTPVPKPIDVGVPRQPSLKSEATIPAAPSATSTSLKRSYDDSRKSDFKDPGSSSQRVGTSGGSSQAKKEEEKEPKKAVPIMVGKRRGGRVLPTGVVKKQRPDSTTEGRTDAWGQYMAEVQKYKAQSCEEERKNRPLVK